MRILKIINNDLGCDNVWVLAESWEAAAYATDNSSVEDFKKDCEEDKAISYDWVTVETLPEATLEKSIEKHWG